MPIFSTESELPLTRPSQCVQKDRTCTFTASRRGLGATSALAETEGPAASRSGEETAHVSNIHESINLPLITTPSADVGLDLSTGLPPLFDYELDTFQFDNIFCGDSEESLNSFFVDLFSCPSYPRVGNQLNSTGSILPLQGSAGSFHSDHNVSLQCYYTKLYPVFPILPPPTQDMLNESPSPSGRDAYEPSSPLLLAIIAILCHSPRGQDGRSMLESERSSDALPNSLALRALNAIENWPATGSDQLTASEFHPGIPRELEPALACCFLSLSQYLHQGDVGEMASLAERAHGLLTSIQRRARDLPRNFEEGFQRAWWVTVGSLLTRMWMLMMIWELYIRTEEALVASTLLLVALVKGFNSQTAVPSFRRNIRVLNEVISFQLTKVDSERQHATSLPESRDADCLLSTSRIRLMSARIKLHRYRALMDHPEILKRFEAISTGSEEQRGSDRTDFRKRYEGRRADEIFPFTAEHSRSICLESALSVAKDLEHLVAMGNHVTPIACSAVLAGYTLMMMDHFQLCSPQAGASASEKEAAQARCAQGVRSCIRSLEAFSVGFDYVRGMKRMCLNNLARAARAGLISQLHRG
ncbi:hypothetical protein CPLU01_06332 [Colletotrichum plurivorum]|uniref:Transcription factor domain-containing protein n=1 Tax=Colletotrichum plurivorum TaxID=2175906 RepID=A0A8H6NGQ1_9PEZI|nr:hypothetical protein CPLU01_06332 [Colletotrichum plurivorum]